MSRDKIKQNMRTKTILYFLIIINIFTVTSCGLIMYGGHNITIKSNPSGAIVYRNGKQTKYKTPCVIKGKKKECTIELKKGGYYPQSAKYYRKPAPIYGPQAWFWAIPIYWPMIPFIPLDIICGAHIIYSYDKNKYDFASHIAGQNIENMFYLEKNPNEINVDYLYDSDYSFYPKDNRNPQKIITNKKFKQCLIYNTIDKSYYTGYWTGKINNGYAEGFGTGYVDSYNKQTKTKFVLGTRIEGVLSNGKPNGSCDIISTSSIGIVAGMKNPYFYYRYSGKFSNGNFDGEVLTTTSEPIKLGPIKNVTHMLIKYSNGEQIGDGFLFDEKNNVLAQGTTKNGRLVFDNTGSNKDLNTILAIVGVTVGAAIIIDKGIDYLHDYYAKNGYSGSASSSSIPTSTPNKSSDESLKTETNKNYDDCFNDKMKYIKFTETLKETPISTTSFECPCEIWMDKGNQWTPTFYKIITSGKWYYGTFGASGPYNSLEEAVKAYCKEKSK